VYEYPHIADETLRIGIGLDSVSTGVMISVKVGLKQAKCFLQFEEDLIQSVQFDASYGKAGKSPCGSIAGSPKSVNVRG